MSDPACNGCQEYLELSRRQFLGVSGGTILAASVPAWLPRVAMAGDFCSARDVVIAVFLRGAMDGMTMCVPYGETEYYAKRPVLSIPPPGSGQPFAATDLNGFFGFPPSMLPLMPAYANGDLLIVHACGSTDTSRSHFDAMALMELGNPSNPSQFTGWLGRHLTTTSPLVPGSMLRAVGMQHLLPRSLNGAPAALPSADITDFGLEGPPATLGARRTTLDSLYNLTTDPLRAAAQTTQATIDLLDTIDFAGYVPAGSAIYPDSPFGRSLKASAALIKAEIGVEAIAIDIEGWDTHIEMGPHEGVLATKLNDLSTALAALHADVLAAGGKNVTVVVMSEFGRRLEENGDEGTDHGHGNAMLVMGNNIAGGQVLTQWPGLAPELLFQQRDLAITIDYRDILAEIIQERLANPNLASVFPNFTPTFRGVTQSCAQADLNCDGTVDLGDVAPFAEAVADQASFRAGSPGCDPMNADLNGDGQLDGRDIQAFTGRLIQP